MASISKFGLTNNQLKIIAMLTMLIDHVGVALLPGVETLRVIGRLSFPIFAYMIAEGCRYTKNRVRYLSTLAGLAIVCQTANFIATRSLYQCVLITFSISVALIFCIDRYLEKKTAARLFLALFAVTAAVFVTVCLPVLLKGRGFEVDYGVFGTLLPVAVYFARGKIQKLVCCAVLLSALAMTLGTRQWLGLLALPLLFLYNGKRGKLNLKYLFYIFYPCHLAVIYLIQSLI